MGGLRRFSTGDEAIAGEWSNSPLTFDDWSLCGSIGVGESGSSHIRRYDGIRGIAKPAMELGVVPRAAHERIASELAVLIGLPVPAVTLWSNPTTGDLYAISLRAFAQPLTWREATNASIVNPAFIASVLPTLLLGYVFHTWIGDTDHQGHPENLLIDAAGDPGSPGLAFIDHAFSMSRSWSVQTPTIMPPPAYYAPPASFNGTDLAQAVARIESVTRDAIEKIVNDVPRNFLSQDRAELIAKGLVHSRDALRGLFS